MILSLEERVDPCETKNHSIVILYCLVKQWLTLMLVNDTSTRPQGQHSFMLTGQNRLVLTIPIFYSVGKVRYLRFVYHEVFHDLHALPFPDPNQFGKMWGRDLKLAWHLVPEMMDCFQ